MNVTSSSSSTKVSSINSSEQPHEEGQSEKAPSSGQKDQGEVLFSRGSGRPGVEDNLFLPSKQGQALSTSFSQSAEIFQELQQECMRRLHVPVGSTPQSSSPSSASCPQTPCYSQTQEDTSHNVLSCNEDKPQIPPRVPIPPRPIKRGDYTAARRSGDVSLSPTPGDTTDDVSCPNQGSPPQIPPRDPLSQSGSRTPSPMSLVVVSPQQRLYSVSPTIMQVPLTSCPSTNTYVSYLSTSPGKLMPTTHSFASDPKYAAPKVIQAQAQGKDSANKGPCILPIVRDGRKVSNTHYYLLPERPPYLDRYDRFFREAESLPASVAEDRHVRQVNTATVRPMVVSNLSSQGHTQGQGLVQSGELKANFSTNNNSSLGGLRSGMKTSVSLPRVCSDGLNTPCMRGDEAGDSAGRVKMVRSQIFEWSFATVHTKHMPCVDCTCMIIILVQKSFFIVTV